MIRLKQLHKPILKECNSRFCKVALENNTFLNELFSCQWNLRYTDYPELGSKDELNDTHKILKQCQNIISKFEGNETNKKLYDALCPILISDTLKSMQLCKSIENLGNKLNSLSMSFIHQAVLSEAVMIWGNDRQREQYLPLLKSGAIQGAFTISDDPSKVSTDCTQYNISGLKRSTPHIDQSRLTLSLANIDDQSSSKKSTVAVLIDSNGSNSSQSRSTDLTINSDYILGSIGSGDKIMRRATATQNLLLSSIHCGRQKNILRQFNKFVNEREVFGVPLFTYEKVKNEMLDVCMDSFLSECMVYFVAGHRDVHLETDWFHECLATQIACEDASARCSARLRRLQSHNSLRGDSPTPFAPSNRPRILLARGILQNLLVHPRSPPSSSQRLMLALGLAPDVRCHSEGLSDSTSSFLHPSMGAIAIRLFIQVRAVADHLSEVCRLRGEAVLEDHRLLVLVSEWVTDVWPMCTALSRVSRSLCLDLPTSMHQLILVSKHFEDLKVRMERRLIHAKSPNSHNVDLLGLARLRGTVDKVLPHPIDL